MKRDDTKLQHHLFAESEGFEPPELRRVQQISSLPQSTTLATFRGKNTTFFVNVTKKYFRILKD